MCAAKKQAEERTKKLDDKRKKIKLGESVLQLKEFDLCIFILTVPVVMSLIYIFVSTLSWINKISAEIVYCLTLNKKEKYKQLFGNDKMIWLSFAVFACGKNMSSRVCVCLFLKCARVCVYCAFECCYDRS